MKIFKVSYETDECNNYNSFVVCENKDDIVNILSERTGEPIEEIRKIKFTEVNKESVKLSELTVGDLLRLISNK